ncbi:MAG: outer membrane protein assembly factor BamA [Sphingobacteriia bacterium]|nr:outer membrane protein assembly factor BamA [Sphingobacteriia bacterium]
MRKLFILFRLSLVLSCFPGYLLLILFSTPAITSAQISLGQQQLEIDYMQPATYEIGAITITGIEYLDRNVLIMISGLSVGQSIKVPSDSFRDAINNLWEQGLFDHVSITATDVRDNLIFLNIDLRERPRMAKYTFKGVSKSEADNLRDEIKISSGDVVTENLLATSRYRIKNYYTKKGFLDAEVEIVQEPDTMRSNSVILTYTIDKKDRVRIYDIEITGNKSLSDDKALRAFKNTKEKGVFKPFNDIEMLIWDVTSAALQLQFDTLYTKAGEYFNQNVKMRIFKSSKYIEDEFEEDKLALIDKYHAAGYRDARIVKDSIYRHEESTINIIIEVDEGPQYYFGDINWVGNTIYTDEFLGSVLGIDKGDTYNKELLNTNLSFNPTGIDVSSLYLDDGYLFFQAVPVEVHVENDTIDLEIRIREGKQARINKVTVKGNTRTNNRVIIRELRSRPGQLFNRSNIIRTTRELAQLRYFNAETIKPDIQPNPADGTVDISYEVEETSADQVELSGGWGYGRIIGTLGLSFNNFSLRNLFKKDAWRPIPSGDGQKLSIRLQSYGKGYISYNFSFTEPWLGGRKPNAFSVSYFHSLYSNGLKKSDTLRSAFVTDGISLGLGKRLEWPDDYFTLYQSLNFQFYSLDNYAQIFSFGSGNGQYNNFNYNVILSRNSIDAPIYPRSGSEISLSLAFTPPYSSFSDKNFVELPDEEKYQWIEYHKWKIKANFYTNIFENLVLSARTQFGFLGSYNPDIGITPFERFYLGGDGLTGYNNFDGRELIGMRGYSNESITPNYYQNSNIGGTIYSKYTFELRYPLSLNPNATIFALAFMESGNSWENFASFNPFKVYRSAGVGMRVFLPMFGILGLDWGYGFDEVPGLPDANKGQFHFSINQSID